MRVKWARIRDLIAAILVFFSLFAIRAAGFWGYLMRDPSAVDGTSVRLWLSYGLWPLALAAAGGAAAYGLGRRALAALGAPGREPLDEVAAAALGLGLLGQAVFLLGWAGGLTPAPLGVLAAAAAALAAGALRRPSWTPPRLGPVAGAAAGLLAFAAASALLDTLAPPIAWDVRAYHLAIPELGLRAGRWAPVPWMLHAHWPHLMEALYALPLAAGRDGVAALLHAGAAFLLVGGTFAVARRAGGPVAGWTAALLLAAQPVLVAEAGTAHSDAAAALLALAAAHALARAEDERRPGWVLAAGLLAGCGAAVKMTSLALLAGWALRLAWTRRRQDAALFLGAGLLVVGPWLVKTWLETGDPVWPFLSRWTGDAAAAALAARNQLSNRWTFPPPAWMPAQDGPGFLLVPLAGLLALARGARRAAASAEERWLWAGAPLLVLLVWRQHAAWRYLMPVWPALALAAGRAAAACLEKTGPRQFAAALLVAAGAAPLAMADPNNALFAVVAPRPASAPAADRRELFLDRSVDVAAPLRAVRSALPPGAKVLLFREVRGYGAGFDYVWGDPMNQALLDYRALDPDVLRARLRALGVTHVLDHPASALYREDPGYYDRRTLALMAECLRRHARPVLETGGVVLYQLL